MAFDLEQREARHLLEALELGKLSTPDTWQLVEQADPALVALIFGWLRARYANHSAREGVYGRMIALTTEYPAARRIVEQGQRDPITEWFEDTFDYRDLDGREFIHEVVAKLEG